MKIVIIGAGPAGLYLSLLLKRSGFPHSVAVIEQNAPRTGRALIDRGDVFRGHVVPISSDP